MIEVNREILKQAYIHWNEMCESEKWETGGRMEGETIEDYSNEQAGWLWYLLMAIIEGKEVSVPEYHAMMDSEQNKD